MESSLLWATTGVGDGSNSGYSQTQMFEWMRALFAGINSANLGGVAPDYLNELAVSGTSSPVSVNTGAAIVYGAPYFNSSSVSVAIPTPSAATRIDRIVLRADWAAQTVRVTRVAGSEGAGAPSMSQVAGTLWDIPLARVSINVSGVITVTDDREWLSVIGDGRVTTAKLASGAVTLAKMAADSVDSDQYVDGSIDTAHIGNNQVTTAKIGDSQVTTAKLANTAVTTAKIGDGQVTAAKMADGAALAEILDDDGSGSGLDADLLDGNHASAFAVAGHNHTLDGLSNVNMSGKASGSYVQWNGSAWTPNAGTVAAAGSINRSHMENDGGFAPHGTFSTNADTTFAATPTTLPLATTLDVSSENVFSSNGTNVTLTEAGVYMLSFGVTVAHDSGSSPAVALAWLEKNSNEIHGSRVYIHLTTNQPGTASKALMVTVAANDVFRIRVQRIIGSDTLQNQGTYTIFSFCQLHQ